MQALILLMSYPFFFAFDMNELDSREMIDCEPIIYCFYDTVCGGMDFSQIFPSSEGRKGWNE